MKIKIFSEKGLPNKKICNKINDIFLKGDDFT